ncbi:TPA: ester cyclase [Legionella pneumophila]|nr:ester cyclase [Legionella pneumophila]HAU1022130.1 ester cyclase [Legionella pneumophila]HAU1597134.1 ester cyclase [Legionella pneumophila]HAW6250260.1 ester cyclase [Legionella pneumophila]
MNTITEDSLTEEQKYMVQVWENHTHYEFDTKNVADTMKTMEDNPYVNNIPTMTGGFGQEEVKQFYSQLFIPQKPDDTEVELISRTVGTHQIVDELIFKFTHNIRMDWILNGIEPTGKRVENPLIAIVRFYNRKIISEHIYWDQASVLVQLGLLNSDKLPIHGVEATNKIRELISRSLTK